MSCPAAPPARPPSGLAASRERRRGRQRRHRDRVGGRAGERSHIGSLRRRAMGSPLLTRLDRAIEALPRSYPGPGGAVAVLRDGEVVARHAWGWANAELRIAFTPKTLFRMCSITKQFTCALVLDAFPDPSVLDGDVARR